MCPAINPSKTVSEKGEQRGFANLLKGPYGTFGNPTVHDGTYPMRMFPVSYLCFHMFIEKPDNAHRI